MAVTRHLIFGSYFCTFAQAAGRLHICTYVVTRSRPYLLHLLHLGQHAVRTLPVALLVNVSTNQRVN